MTHPYRIARVVASGLALLSCQSTTARCPGEEIAVRVDFFGDLAGSGVIKFFPERFGAVRFEGNVTRGGAVVAKLGGSGTCRGGVIGATFGGESVSQRGLTVKEGKLTATLGPQPLGGQLAGAWDATLLYHNGPTRPITGFFRDERPPQRNDPMPAVSASASVQ